MMSWWFLCHSTYVVALHRIRVYWVQRAGLYCGILGHWNIATWLQELLIGLAAEAGGRAFPKPPSSSRCVYREMWYKWQRSSKPMNVALMLKSTF